MTTAPGPRDPAGHWDPVWESIFSRRGWGQYPPEPVIREVMRAFGSRSDRASVRMLDLGCGPGAITWFLAREGFSVAGIDGSPSALVQNRTRLAREGLEAELREGDFTKALPWDDGRFDAVIDNASAYSNPLAAIADCFAEVRRVLRPGGLFVSLSFSDRTWGYGLGAPGRDPGSCVSVDEGPLQGSGYVQFLSRADLDRLLAPFAARSIERSSYTLCGGQRLVELWVVACRTANA